MPVKTYQLFYDERTPWEVKVMLDDAWYHNWKVRIWYGDTDTGKSWMDENDIMGYVGRSTGIHKIPLMLYQRGSDGGSGILDHCIIRLDILRTVWTTDYVHPQFYLPSFTINPCIIETAPDLVVEVRCDGEVNAAFDSWPKACHWVAFMTGLSHDWPVDNPDIERD